MLELQIQGLRGHRVVAWRDGFPQFAVGRSSQRASPADRQSGGATSCRGTELDWWGRARPVGWSGRTADGHTPGSAEEHGQRRAAVAGPAIEVPNEIIGITLEGPCPWDRVCAPLAWVPCLAAGSAWRTDGLE